MTLIKFHTEGVWAKMISHDKCIITAEIQSVILINMISIYSQSLFMSYLYERDSHFTRKFK